MSGSNFSTVTAHPNLEFSPAAIAVDNFTIDRYSFIFEIERLTVGTLPNNNASFASVKITPGDITFERANMGFNQQNSANKARWDVSVDSLLLQSSQSYIVQLLRTPAPDIDVCEDLALIHPGDNIASWDGNFGSNSWGLSPGGNLNVASRWKLSNAANAYTGGAAIEDWNNCKDADYLYAYDSTDGFNDLPSGILSNIQVGHIITLNRSIDLSEPSDLTAIQWIKYEVTSIETMSVTGGGMKIHTASAWICSIPTI